ncbi:MAG: hypothetical protein NTV61_03180 [Candidatus Bathyarchaeota archaeon]|nr:hypothetical protein [Candidatus Bathyarchaeota archaeon]
MFIGSAIVFNLLVSALYVFTKLDQMAAVRAVGVPIILLMVPFGYTLIGFLKSNIERRIIISNAVIIVYLLLELLLDFILLIPFREILVIHVPYILVFYAAEFSMIGVSFRLNRGLGFAVLFTFFILIGCLIFMYLG